MKKSFAEFLGTFTLVLLGCGAAVIAGKDVGFLGISFAFGFALISMAYAIGPISGCHINPAVSFGAWVAGRLETKELFQYILAQCLGAIFGALVLYLIASGKAGSDLSGGIGQNGWGAGYLGEYSFFAAFLFEFVATFLFMTTILGVTQGQETDLVAGLVIGITLVVIHIVGINITGVSVNPARSLGPALFSGSHALMQLPMFIIAPLLGAGLSGYLFKIGILTKE